MITVRIDRIATTYALGYCPDRPTPASEPTRHATVQYALVFTGDHYPTDLDTLAPAIHAANTNLNPINIDIHDIRKRTVAHLPATPLTPRHHPSRRSQHHHPVPIRLHRPHHRPPPHPPTRPPRPHHRLAAARHRKPDITPNSTDIRFQRTAVLYSQTREPLSPPTETTTTKEAQWQAATPPDATATAPPSPQPNHHAPSAATPSTTPSNGHTPTATSSTTSPPSTKAGPTRYRTNKPRTTAATEKNRTNPCPASSEPPECSSNPRLATPKGEGRPPTPRHTATQAAGAILSQVFPQARLRAGHSTGVIHRNGKGVGCVHSCCCPCHGT